MVDAIPAPDEVPLPIYRHLVHHLRINPCHLHGDAFALGNWRTSTVRRALGAASDEEAGSLRRSTQVICFGRSHCDALKADAR